MSCRNRLVARATIFAVSALVAASLAAADRLGPMSVFDVVELEFGGPMQALRDTPARDVRLSAVFRHESGAPEYEVHGFYDGDGLGGPVGNVFKIRFCPTAGGRWEVVDLKSNRDEFGKQHVGDSILAVAPGRPGFWEVDEASPGRRWYRRSDGSHQYIIGNTHYSFLSETGPGGKPTGRTIEQDVLRNAQFFKKLRFGLTGDRYPHPTEKPFVDDVGRPTNNGDYSYRPNPRWFRDRVDLAVRTAFQADMIADLILCGPDVPDSRATLRAQASGGDPEPWLRYIAARYGSYPNVWICMANEFEIKSPKYLPQQIAQMGQTIRRYLPYPTPLSVHMTSLWPAAFDGLPPWHDHHIIQKKLRDLTVSADAVQQTWRGPSTDSPRNKPTVNDELSYQGNGDRHTADDTLVAHVGAFLGGGYGSTGYKSGEKLGQYFWGRFEPLEHSAVDDLKWLSDLIDREIPFGHMAPDVSIFTNGSSSYRGLAWPDRAYVLGTDGGRKSVVAKLPPGRWTIGRHDVLKKQSSILANDAEGDFTFDVPDARAVLFVFRNNTPPPQ